MSSASLGQICQKSHLRVLNPTWRLYREGGGEKERTGRTSQTIPKMTFLLNHGSTIFLFAYVEIGESPRNSTESNGAIVFFFSYFIFFLYTHLFVVLLLLSSSYGSLCARCEHYAFPWWQPGHPVPSKVTERKCASAKKKARKMDKNKGTTPILAWLLLATSQGGYIASTPAMAAAAAATL